MGKDFKFSDWLTDTVTHFQEEFRISFRAHLKSSIAICPREVSLE